MKTVKLNGKKILLLVAVAFIATILAVLSIPTQTIEAEASGKVQIDYVNANGTAQTPLDCIELKDDVCDVDLNGNYYVDGNVTLSGSVKITGSSIIILKNGCTLNLTKTMGMNENQLTIYAQTTDNSVAGSMFVTAEPNNNTGYTGIYLGSLTIEGGNIQIEGGESTQSDKAGGYALFNVNFTFKGGSVIFVAGKSGDSYQDTVSIADSSSTFIIDQNAKVENIYYGNNIDGTGCCKLVDDVTTDLKDDAFVAINPACVKRVTLSESEIKTSSMYANLRINGIDCGLGGLVYYSDKNGYCLYILTQDIMPYTFDKTKKEVVRNLAKDVFSYNDGCLSCTVEEEKKFLFFFKRKTTVDYYVTANSAGELSATTEKTKCEFCAFEIKMKHNIVNERCTQCNEKVVEEGEIGEVIVTAEKLTKKVLFFNIPTGEYRYTITVKPEKSIGETGSVAVSWDNKMQAKAMFSNTLTITSKNKSFYIWVKNSKQKKTVYKYENGKVTEVK